MDEYQLKSIETQKKSLDVLLSAQRSAAIADQVASSTQVVLVAQTDRIIEMNNSVKTLEQNVKLSRKQLTAFIRTQMTDKCFIILLFLIVICIFIVIFIINWNTWLKKTIYSHFNHHTITPIRQ